MDALYLFPSKSKMGFLLWVHEKTTVQDVACADRRSEYIYVEEMDMYANCVMFRKNKTQTN